MPIMKIAAIDPSLANFGMAKMNLDLQTMKFDILDFMLIETDRQVSKQVRQNSDDLRRCKLIYRGFSEFVKDCAVVFAEIPSGAQSASALKALAMVTGLLAGCPKPLIQVQPAETKIATVGTRTASKEEMIAWAAETYPDAAWLRVRKSGKLLAKNEHLADACAIAHAGIATDQFLQVVALWRSAA